MPSPLYCPIRQDFPFDTQEIEINMQIYGCPMQSKNLRKLSRMVPCRIEDIRYTRIPVQTMFEEGQLNYISELHGLETNNWTLIGCRTAVVPVFYDFLGIDYATLNLTFAVQRKWRFYKSRIFSCLILISLLSFLSFGFEVEEFEQRINLLLVVFLAAVAFQFTLSDSIPQVNYMTKLDRYLLVLYGLIAGLAYEAVTISRLEKNGYGELARDIDGISIIAFPSIFLIFNVGYFILAYKIRTAVRHRQPPCLRSRSVTSLLLRHAQPR